MDKVYVVECGYDYEGSDVQFVASSQQAAEQWRDKYFEFRDPYPDDKKWKSKFRNKWCSRNNDIVFGSYDSIKISERELDKDPYDTQRDTDSA